MPRLLELLKFRMWCNLREITDAFAFMTYGRLRIRAVP